MPRNCVVILLHRRLTRSAIYGNQIFDSHTCKWSTVFIRKVKGKPRNFEAMLCGSLFLLLKHLSNHAFYNKRLHMLFIDQLVRSKATCSFNFGSYGQSSIEPSVVPVVLFHVCVNLSIANKKKIKKKVSSLPCFPIKVLIQKQVS